MEEYLRENKVSSVSIILPVMDETESLRKTVEIIYKDNKKYIAVFVIVICDKTKKQSLKVIDELKKEYGKIISIIKQTRPFLGGAIRDAFDILSTSHVVLMASDLETPPERVKTLIELEIKNPSGIVTCSRWIEGGGFKNYNPFKYLFNYIFQALFKFLFRTRLSDMTYGYRIFPVKLVQSIKWQELRHAFLFETIIKPLKLNVKVEEISCTWESRKEGTSYNTFLQNFIYFRTGLKTFFSSREDVLIKSKK